VFIILLLSAQKLLTESLQILKDDKKREAFDKFGAASQAPGFDPNAFASGFGGGFPGFAGFAGQTKGRDGPGDFFEQLFNSFSGGNGSRSRHLQGDDIQATVTVSFLEACKGTKKKVTISPVDDCSTCSATGLKPGVQRSTCSGCKGTGSRTFVLDSGFQMASTCRQCDGEGTTIPRGGECSPCGGAGKIRSKRTVNITVPVGTQQFPPTGLLPSDIFDRCRGRNVSSCPWSG
jgi:molecular chaperone DnaJ